MKKTCDTILFCTMLMLSLGGCGGTQSSDLPKQEQTAIVSQESNAQLSPQLPPLSPELQTLYEEANQFLSNIAFSGFLCDYNDTVKIDDIDYYRVSTAIFADYTAFENTLRQLFTDDFIEENILGENRLFVRGENDELYFCDGARGANIFYAGHTFSIDSQTEEEIDFTATVYYTKDEPYEGDFFYTAPDNPADYDTEEYSFRLLHEDGQWKFDEFSMLF